MQRRKVYFIVLVTLLLLSLLHMTAAAQTAPAALPLGEIIQEFVNETQMSHQYAFSALDHEPIFLLAASQDYEAPLNVVLSNQLTTENVMMAKLNVSGMCLRIVPGDTNYVLNIAAQNPQQAQWYGLLLTTSEPDTIACSEENFGLLATMATTADGALGINRNIDVSNTSCLAVANTEAGITIQTSTANDPLAGIGVDINASVAVIGSVDAQALLLINANGTIGFVPRADVSVSGNCTAIPVVTIVGNIITGTESLIDLILGTVSTAVSVPDSINTTLDVAGNVVDPVTGTVTATVDGTVTVAEPVVISVESTGAVVVEPIESAVEVITSTEVNTDGAGEAGNGICLDGLGLPIGC
ncbi:MAG: hypothetical protein KC547_06635 [Anaerolineae bacterium]|nr:hypothetical protein [Anaerolineae bacterium]